MILTHGKFDERDINIKIKDTRLKQVKCTKFLGIMIDNKLSYCDHLTKITKTTIKSKGCFIKVIYFTGVYHETIVLCSVTLSHGLWGGGVGREWRDYPGSKHVLY